MLHFALPTVRPPISHPLGFRAGHLRARENAVGADYERLDRPKYQQFREFGMRACTRLQTRLQPARAARFPARSAAYGDAKGGEFWSSHLIFPIRIG